jgi:site-specific DNA recombinase
MRIVGYVRVSTEKQADAGVSLEAQVKKIETYGELYELEVVGIFDDRGLSAKHLNRPGLREALAKLTSGEAEGLLICKLDRLTRSVRDLDQLITEYFADGRFALISISETVDTRTATGRMVLNILASVSQWEREAIGERTRDALSHIKSEGARLGGEALGWRRLEEKDEANRRIVAGVEPEIETVRRIAKLREEGLSMREIAARIAVEGHRTKRGGLWHASTVKAVLDRCGSRNGGYGNERVEEVRI